MHTQKLDTCFAPKTKTRSPEFPTLTRVLNSGLRVFVLVSENTIQEYTERIPHILMAKNLTDLFRFIPSEADSMIRECSHEPRLSEFHRFPIVQHFSHPKCSLFTVFDRKRKPLLILSGSVHVRLHSTEPAIQYPSLLGPMTRRERSYTCSIIGQAVFVALNCDDLSP